MTPRGAGAPLGGGGAVEVDGVTGVADRRADGGVDGALGDVRGPKRGGERLREQRRDDALVPPFARLKAGQLAVIAKAAACHVDGGDDRLDRRGCGVEAVGGRDHHVHRRAESGTSMRGKGHEPPLTVLADDALPELADPVESEDDPLLADEEDDGRRCTATATVPAR